MTARPHAGADAVLLIMFRSPVAVIDRGAFVLSAIRARQSQKESRALRFPN